MWHVLQLTKHAQLASNCKKPTNFPSSLSTSQQQRNPISYPRTNKASATLVSHQLPDLTCHPPQSNNSPQWKSITIARTICSKGSDNGYWHVCVCVLCRFCSPRHTTLGSLVLPVINTGLKSPTVTRLPYCLFCPWLNNELDPLSNAELTLVVDAHLTHTHTHENAETVNTFFRVQAAHSCTHML